MKEVDAIRIREQVSNLSQARGYLEELRQLPRGAFLSDFRNTAGAKYLLLVATESAIDICNHIAARRSLRAPSNYGDCFMVLAGAKIISPDLADRLKAMAQFRNVLVHLYWEVDDGRVYDVLQNNLGDLDEFREQIAGWMKSTSRSG